jgi:hypothetical protein
MTQTNQHWENQAKNPSEIKKSSRIIKLGDLTR